MTTILADSFRAALARLGPNEQKQTKLTVYELQENPGQPGLSFHRMDKSRDPNFWSVRVSGDIRIIVHKTGDSVLLAYVGHHDDAYHWAERRVIDEHPRTGAIQIREVRELVEEIRRPSPIRQPGVAEARPSGEPPAGLVPPPMADVALGRATVAAPVFTALSDDNLLSIGVPPDWLADVRFATDDSFFDLAGHLPEEAREALLEYAATGLLSTSPPPTADPLQHPDTQRRFRVLENINELQAALDSPFDKWAIFLHPTQRGIVERTFNGPARVAGSAGTGKTVVALHRVLRILQSNPDARVLLTTFSRPLAKHLEYKLGILFGERKILRARVDIGAFNDVAAELCSLATGRKPNLASEEHVRKMLAQSAEDAEATELSPQFLHSEWKHVIDAWQIETVEAYAAVPRMGRQNRLGPRQRERLWQVFGPVREKLAARGLMTEAGMFAAATALYRDREVKPFTHIVVDEAQDLGVAELRFLSAIAPASPGALFFAGDLGQRIFQQPFSWKGLGVDVRGRSATLRVNYRTSHQIRRAADRLLPQNVRDVDGIEDGRTGTISVFDGPDPTVVLAPTSDAEVVEVAALIKAALAEGTLPGEIGIFVRSGAELPRARAAAGAAGLPARNFVDRDQSDMESALVGTMHLAKGLEFRMVVLMACDESVLPQAARLADVADAFELEEVLTTERQLFYVAATRARDRLIISAVQPGSDFIGDISEPF
ncbi:MAG: helicase [Devosia sp.]|uniref:3'-5' exonuclease n=1 Tax=Devosia sp. TaxID=1871048 RepID=UPI00260F7A41|nr:3'-5' exonuclease [Devosia sp.]MDB5540081.1 helicase [Devosia sp.]